MFYKQIKISFSGSFQCRLATDVDQAADSLNDPYGDMGQPPSKGWTFAYGETRFDRIIRCQTPVQLRTALVDPWEPVKVKQIQVQPESFFPGPAMAWQTIPADPLLNLSVSLGNQAIFDTPQGGGGPGKEAILNCIVTFGDLLTATPVGTPKLKGPEQVSAWSTEYATKKPAAILPLLSSMNATRRKVLTTTAPNNFVEYYRSRFSYKDEISPINTNVDFSPAGTTGILAAILTGWSWTLHLTFSRFDGDTLVGRVEGDLSGFHSDF